MGNGNCNPRLPLPLVLSTVDRYTHVHMYMYNVYYTVVCIVCTCTHNTDYSYGLFTMSNRTLRKEECQHSSTKMVTYDANTLLVIHDMCYLTIADSALALSHVPSCPPSVCKYTMWITWLKLVMKRLKNFAPDEGSLLYPGYKFIYKIEHTHTCTLYM